MFDRHRPFRRPLASIVGLTLAGSLCLGASVGLSCASKSRGPADSAASPVRIKDSPPEKGAALRNADPNLGAEADEQRWGFEAAREQKQRTDEKQRASSPGSSTAPASTPPTGPFDLRAKSTKQTTPTATTP